MRPTDLAVNPPVSDSKRSPWGWVRGSRVTTRRLKIAG